MTLAVGPWISKRMLIALHREFNSAAVNMRAKIRVMMEYRRLVSQHRRQAGVLSIVSGIVLQVSVVDMHGNNNFVIVNTVSNFIINTKTFTNYCVWMMSR